MLKYAQPDFYKFNQDSLELVQFTHQSLLDSRIESVLDVGSGSGIIGIEYSLKTNVKIDLLELQSEFIPYINQNIEKFKVENMSVIHSNFFDYSCLHKYDLIILNPPYFTFERSRKSDNHNKNICRLITKIEISKWIKKIQELISFNGYLAICYPEANEDWNTQIHSMNLETVKTKTIGAVKYLILKNIKSF